MEKLNSEMYHLYCDLMKEDERRTKNVQMLSQENRALLSEVMDKLASGSTCACGTKIMERFNTVLYNLTCSIQKENERLSNRLDMLSQENRTIFEFKLMEKEMLTKRVETLSQRNQALRSELNQRLAKSNARCSKECKPNQIPD